MFTTRASSVPVSVALLMAMAVGCSKSHEVASSPASSAAAQKQVVEVIPVKRQDLIETLTVVGSMAANESAEIRPEIAGLVREILFAEGGAVKKGQVLLKIDDEELRSQFAQVEARYQLAELNVARSDSLGDMRSIPQSEIDRLHSEFAVSKAERALLRTRLEKMAVKAPFDGIVGSRVISPGDYVTASSAITTLDDLSRMKVDFQVPERFLGKVNKGTTFLVRARALDADTEVRGEVYFVSSIIDRNTRSSEVKGLLHDPPAVLKPGMFANIELVLDVRRNALTVPEGSILISPTGSQVIAVRDQGGEKVAEFVPVEIGLRTRGLAEVTPTGGALAENDSIVASGVGALILYPGARLEPRPLRAEFRVGD